MVKLRLRRKGRAHHPVYDIVAVDGRARRDGAFLERLGYYDPNTKPSTISINSDRAVYWLNVGAQPTETVSHLLSYEGVLLARHLQFKGKSKEEIDAEVTKHKKVSADRFARRAALRVQRKVNKVKAEEEAKLAEAAAAEAAKKAAEEEAARKAAEEAAAAAAAAEAPAAEA